MPPYSPEFERVVQCDTLCHNHVLSRIDHAHTNVTRVIVMFHKCRMVDIFVVCRFVLFFLCNITIILLSVVFNILFYLTHSVQLLHHVVMIYRVPHKLRLHILWLSKHCCCHHVIFYVFACMNVLLLF